MGCCSVKGDESVQKFSFGLTDLTSFDKPAGEFVMEPQGVARRGHTIAADLVKSMPQTMLAGLCIVAFDAAGNLAALVPLATVH
jgi:hypothetical protein